MDLQVRKYDLIQALVRMNDEDLLEKLESVIASHQVKGDWWNDLPKEEEDAINEGIAQLDKGTGISDREMRKRINTKLEV